MINITPTFLHEYYNTSRGFPEGIDTNINHPVITMEGKKATAVYRSFAKRLVNVYKFFYRSYIIIKNI